MRQNGSARSEVAVPRSSTFKFGVPKSREILAATVVYRAVPWISSAEGTSFFSDGLG